MDDLTRIKGIGPAAAKKLVAEGIDTFEKLAQANVKAEWIHEAETILADRQNTQGKPPRPVDGSESHAEAGALPADSGAGDPQQDNPRGSSGTAREASSTGGGTTAETPSVGTQSSSPNLSSDTESLEVAAVTKLEGPHSLLVPAEIYEAGREMVSDALLAEPGGIETSETAEWRVFEDLAGEERERRYPLMMAALYGWTATAVRAGDPERFAAGPNIRIVAKRDGFRRAGLSHPKSPVDHQARSLTPDQIEQLLGEPKLKVEFV